MAIRVADTTSNAVVKATKESKKRTFAKTVSWRTVASIDTFLIGFFVLKFLDSNTEAAAMIALVEIPNKLVIYYLHERVWSRIKYGLPKVEEYSI